MRDLIPAFFIGGPVAVIAAGAAGAVFPAAVALAFGVVLGEAIGMMVLRAIRY